jgi:hypothetical protein
MVVLAERLDLPEVAALDQSIFWALRPGTCPGGAPDVGPRRVTSGVTSLQIATAIERYALLARVAQAALTCR